MHVVLMLGSVANTGPAIKQHKIWFTASGLLSNFQNDNTNFIYFKMCHTTRANLVAYTDAYISVYSFTRLSFSTKNVYIFYLV